MNQSGKLAVKNENKALTSTPDPKMAQSSSLSQHKNLPMTGIRYKES